MRLLFKQRFLSWFDSFDIYDEAGNTVFTVEGRLAWGHKYMGQIKKEFTFFKPRFTLDCGGWQVEGDWLEWDYRVTDHAGRLVMTAQKELLRWTDTYTIDIAQPEDVLLCLMIVLAIDAAKCSSGN